MPARLAVAGLLSTCGLHEPVAAADPGALPLDEVLRATLASNPEIQLAVQQAESARGALLSSGAAFDLTLASTGAESRVHTSDPRDGADAIQKRLSYQVEVQRLFRNGISVAPDVALTRTSLSTLPGSSSGNTASVGLTLGLPLLRDRGGAESAASERAAAHDYEASLLALRHTTAQRVLSAVVAYWDYLSAQRRLDVSRASEERAQRTADQTRVLVQAEERTPADLTQILGNLASKKVSRISFEQAVVEAQQQLGLAVGLPAEQIPWLPPAATDFPIPPAPGALGTASQELVDGAYARRSDLAAAEQDLLATRSLLDGTRSELKPRLDLVVSSGYTTTGDGLGFGPFFTPLYRPGPKLDASLQLSFQLPLANSRARGRLLQTASASEQQRILRDDLRRRISTGVAVALQALQRGAAGVTESEEAVRLSESTVQAEQRKFQLGVSTLFDVIQAQDGLTNALLGQIQSQRNYAVAIATLRFQSGTLVFGQRDQPTVETASLLSPP